MNSLPKPRFTATLALHSLMDQAQIAEISQRARGLKEASRETNRSIADYCDVTERTVAGWLSPREPKPMTWDHAEKVAALFEVDVDWLWRGREKGATPDMLAAFQNGNMGELGDQLNRIETMLKNLTQVLIPADADLARRATQRAASAREQHQARRQSPEKRRAKEKPQAKRGRSAAGTSSSS